MSEPRSRREMVAVLILLIAGAILALVATTLPWGWAYLDGADTLPVPGHAVAPNYLALPLFALASAVAVVATRRVGRMLTGAALAVTAVVAAQSSISLGIALSDDVREWAVGAGHDVVGASGGSSEMIWYPVSCGLIFVTGVWIAVRGRRWPSMGSRYERMPAQPPTAERLTSREAWDALDRGNDPTT